MCQALSQGGRRCAIHTENSKAVFKQLRAREEISIRQLHNLFTEERYQGALIETFSPEQRETFLNRLVEEYPEIPEPQELSDGDIRAYLALKGRIQEFNTNLSDLFSRVAIQQGRTVGEVEEAYTLALTRYERRNNGDWSHVNRDIAEFIVRDVRAPSHTPTIAAIQSIMHNQEHPSDPDTGWYNVFEETNGEFHSINVRENDQTESISVHNHEGVTTYTLSTGVFRSYWDSSSDNVTGESLIAFLESNKLEETFREAGERCRLCGQFSSQRNGHSCPERNQLEIARENFINDPAAYREVFTAILRGETPFNNENLIEDESPVDETVRSLEIAEGLPEDFHAYMEHIATNVDPTKLGRLTEGSLVQDTPDEVLSKITPIALHETRAQGYDSQTINDLPVSSIRVINTTIRSKFISYFEDNSEMHFENDDAARAAIEDPANEDRLFLHGRTTSGSNMKRYFLGTVPRGIIVSRTPRSVVITQRFNNTGDDGLSPLTADEISRLEQEFEDSDLGSTYREIAGSIQTNDERPTHVSGYYLDEGIVNDAALRIINNEPAIIKGVFKTNNHLPPTIISLDGKNISVTDLGNYDVHFDALYVPSEDSSGSLHHRSQLKCTCPVYESNYRCEHTRYVSHTLLSETSKIVGSQTQLNSSNGEVVNFLSPRVRNLNLKRLITNNNASVKLQYKEEEGLQIIANLDEENPSSVSAYIPTASEILSNIDSDDHAERVLALRESLNVTKYNVPPVEMFRETLKRAPEGTVVNVGTDAATIITGVTHNDHNKCPIAYDKDTERFILHRGSLRCASCGRFMSDDGCSHVVDYAHDLDKFERLLNGEETGVLSDGDLEERIRNINLEIKNANEEKVIANIMASRNISREEVEALLSNSVPSLLPIDFTLERAAQEMEERALNNSSLSAYRNFVLDNSLVREVNETSDLFPSNISEERRERIIANQESRDLLWLTKDEEMTEEQAKRILKGRHNIRNGALATEFRTEGVTDGLCDPNSPSPMGFGIEIEFVGGDTSQIQRELYDAGLATERSVGYYHNGQSNNWSGFNVENDCTVTGELVTPILYDTPEDWDRLNRALEILKANGARITSRAGGHINISSANLAGNSAKHVEIARTLKECQSTFYEIAKNPTARNHRGMRWCTPALSTPQGDVPLSQYDFSALYRDRLSLNDDPEVTTRGFNGETPYSNDYLHHRMAHGAFINFSASRNTTDNARIEYRVWDGSLDIGVLQTRVAISAALVDYADRTVREKGFSPVRSAPEETQGTHMENALTLANKIFRRQEDRERLLDLLAFSKNTRDQIS